MHFFQKLIAKNDIGKQISIFCAFLLNTIMVSFFIMTITGLDNITNDKLSSNDMEQILSIISSMVSTGIITILFLQWIVWTLYRALLDSRNNFNNIVRMIGMSNKKLFSIYFREFILLQLYTLPFSIIFSWLFYYIILNMYGFTSQINVFSIFIAIIINFVISFCSLYIAYIKNNKHISYQSKTPSISTVNKRINNKLLYRMRIASGLVILFLLVYLSFINFIQPYKYLLFLIPIILIFDEIINLMCIVIDICLPPKYHSITSLINGNRKSIKIISYTMIFGLTLVFGLNSLIITSRNVAYNLVMENVLYEEVIISEDFFDEDILITDRDNINTALLFINNNIGSSQLGVMGIDSKYIDQFENFDFKYASTTKSDFKEKLNDIDFNGIILPEILISEEDIGSTIKLSIGNEEIDFVILGGYYVNDFSTMFAFASKEYISHRFHIESKANVAYVKNNNNISEIKKLLNSKVITKKEVANDSYNKVVQSTFILEITAFIVLLASFFMLSNYIYISSGQDKVDIARMRCIGLSKNQVNVIYIANYVLVILISSLIGFFSAYTFGITGVYLLLDEKFLVNGLLFSWIPYFLVVVTYIVTSLVLYVLITRKTKSEYLSLIRIKIQKN